MRRLGLVSAFIAAMVCSAAASQTDPAPATNAAQNWCDLQQGVSPSRLAKMRRGFNLTGWLDGPERRRPNLSTLSDLRARGFTHIRLPLKPELIAPEFSSADEIAKTYKELMLAIDTLLALKFSVSVDLHPGSQVAKIHRETPDRGLLLLDRLWTELATRLSSYPPEDVFFEILNEPDVSPEVWHGHGVALARTIRRIAPHHTIIYAPPTYQTISALNDLTPLADRNVVYAVHFYQPMVFTHQGQTWDARDARRHIAFLPFPSDAGDTAVQALTQRLAETHPDAARLIQDDLQRPWTEARILEEMSRITDWMTRHRRPVILNEFGVLTFKTAPGDRERWLAAVTRSAEHFCIGWTHWEYGDAFGFVRRTERGDKIDEGIVGALLRK